MFMKKNLIFATVLTVFALVLGASAQDTKKAAETRGAGADFSGKWTLDLAKSDLGQMATMIKGGTLSIAQSGASFKVTTNTDRVVPTEGAPGGGGGGARPAGGGGMGGAAPEMSYSLDGKEVSSEQPARNGGTVTIKTKAEQSGSKVSISTTRPGPNGDTTTTTTYELSADGKMLTVVRPAGQGGTSKWVYTKS
jgi:hypothetical protein